MSTYPYTVKNFVGANVASETLIWQPQPGMTIKVYGYSLSLSRGLGPIVFKDGWGGKTILTVTPTALNQAATVGINADKLLATTSANSPLVLLGAPQAVLYGFICLMEG